MQNEIPPNQVETINRSGNLSERLHRKSLTPYTGLKCLILSSNNLSELPEKLFYDLVNLNYLNLSRNQLTEFNLNLFNKDNLVTLTELNISSNKLVTLDTELFHHFCNLDWLNLSDNYINNVDNAFMKLGALQMLILSSNHLEKIKAEIFHGLANLKYLNMSNNQLTTLDQNVFKSLTKLYTLDLSNNKLAEINLNFSSKLKLLNVSCNVIKQFKANKNIIKELILFNNKLDFSIEIPQEKIVKLDISSNKLDERPRFVCGNLKFLNMNNNSIKEFDDSTMPNLKELFLQNNKLENIEVGCRNLKTLDLGRNKLSQAVQIDLSKKFNKINLETDYKNRNHRMSLISAGHISSIKNHKLKDFPQLDNFEWLEIPMFSVLTGKNGIGKSSVLTFVHERLKHYYYSAIILKTKLNDDEFELMSPHFASGIQLPLKTNDTIIPLSLKINDKIEPICDSTFFSKIIDEDNDYILNKQAKHFAHRHFFHLFNKANIFTFNSIEACLKHLHTQLDSINEHLEKYDEFKYKKIVYVDGKYVLGEQLKVKIEMLSPGEHIILLLLLWEYIFDKYEVYGKTVLLFDEPDSPLHPSAVRSVLDTMKRLSEKGVQIIMTTHNSTTASFVDRDNLFLLYRDGKDDTLKIRKGQTNNEVNSFLTTNLVSVALPTKSVFVREDSDVQFYQMIGKHLNTTAFYKCPFGFQLNFQTLSKSQFIKPDFHNTLSYDLLNKPLQQNKEDLISTIRALGVSNKFFSLVDNGGDLQSKSAPHVRNLLYLKRDARENYVLDPVNVYFYLKSLRNEGDYFVNNNKKITKLLDLIATGIENVDKKYAYYDLRTIIDALYGTNEAEASNCVKVIELIVKQVFDELKEAARELIYANGPVAIKLFALPIYKEGQNISNCFLQGRLYFF